MINTDDNIDKDLVDKPKRKRRKVIKKVKTEKEAEAVKAAGDAFDIDVETLVDVSDDDCDEPVIFTQEKRNLTREMIAGKVGIEQAEKMVK